MWVFLTALYSSASFAASVSVYSRIYVFETNSGEVPTKLVRVQCEPVPELYKGLWRVQFSVFCSGFLRF